MAQGIGGFVDRIQIGTDEANQIAIGSSAYGYCETVGSEDVKKVVIPGFNLKTGTTIHVKFKYANSASNSPKLNVLTTITDTQGTGAKEILQYEGENAGVLADTTGWNAGAVLTLTYDGTAWIRDSGYNTNTVYTLPTATSSDLGGIKIGFTTSAQDRKYAVQLDNNDKAYVNIPWTDTDTNDKVEQKGITTTSDEYNLLLKATSDDQDETNYVNFVKTTNKQITANPSTGALTVPGGIIGSATSWLYSRNIYVNLASTDATPTGTALNSSNNANQSILGIGVHGVLDYTHIPSLGNLTNEGQITTAITLAQNDYIIIGDADDNGTIGKGPIFDGSTTNQALTPQGTWESVVNSIGDLTGEITVNTLLQTLGLDSALHFIGVTTSPIENGYSTSPIVINNDNYTPNKGDIVLRSVTSNNITDDREYLWTGTEWRLLGYAASVDYSSSSIYNISNPPDDTTDYAWLSNITQYTTGKISITKTKIRGTSGNPFIGQGNNAPIFYEGLTLTGDGNNTAYNANFSNSVSIQGATTINGITTINNATDSDGTAGALVITGGATIGKNLYINKNLYIPATNDEELLIGNTTIGTLINAGKVSILADSSNNNTIYTYGYYLKNGSTVYGQLYIGSLGTQNAAGTTILSLGNNVGTTNTNVTSNLNNSKGIIRIYSSGTTYTDIQSQSGNSQTFYLPAYNADMYAVHVGDNTAVGSGTQPVYIAANGRATKLTYEQNRLYYGASPNSFAATGHYASSTKLGINYIGQNEPGENLYVNGTTQLGGKVGIGIVPEPEPSQSAVNPDVHILTINGSTKFLYNGEVAAHLDTKTTIINSSDYDIAEFYPETDNTGTLGLSNHKWSAVYIGGNTTYGDAYSPIYWDNGVPTPTKGVIQYAAFTIAANKYGVVIVGNGIIEENSYVLQIVITSGQQHLPEPLTWESDVGQITLKTLNETVVTGQIQGYILIARGTELTSPSISFANLPPDISPEPEPESEPEST